MYNANERVLESVRLLTTDPLTFGKAATVPKRLQGGPPGSRTPYDLMPDGNLIGLITAGQKQYGRGPANEIQVVINWFEELRTVRPR